MRQSKSNRLSHSIYTPTEIVTTANPDNYTPDQQGAIYARSSFPTTEVQLHDLTFKGGPEGEFFGTNSETGEQYFGQLRWSAGLKEMPAIFTQDIQQDCLVIAEKPF